MPDEVSILLLLFAVVVTVIGWHWWSAEKTLRQWARKNGYEILRKRFRWSYSPFVRGPIVYHVLLKDSGGAQHTAWVWCGSAIWGLASDRVKVNWIT